MQSYLEDDYITYATLWPYTFSRIPVKRCIKCGRIEKL